MTGRFAAPWSLVRIEGGFTVLDDTCQALAYVYFRTSAENADPGVIASTWPNQAVQKGDIVHDACGVQGETEPRLKRRGAIIKR